MSFPFSLFFPRRRVAAAIVSTVRNAANLLPSFLQYHFAVGFSRVFLFFDSKADPSIEIARQFPFVTTTVRDAKLERLWLKTRVYRTNPRVRNHLETEAMARQILNAELGLRMALQQRITWLLHIDADELFYCPGGLVTEHFRQLANQGCACVKYLNHEAIPESSDLDDCFREATLFKRNPALLPENPDQHANPNLYPKQSHFQFYTNGKSAVKVTRSALPIGVHDFSPGPQRRFSRQRRTLLLADPYAPVILHYPCCGFENFWTKYVTLGHFADKWWGTVDISSPFHLESRDVVAQRDKVAARLCYEQAMVLRDPAVKAAQLKNNRFTRITYPAEVLDRLRIIRQSKSDSGIVRSP